MHNLCWACFRATVLNSAFEDMLPFEKTRVGLRQDQAGRPLTAAILKIAHSVWPSELRMWRLTPHSHHSVGSNSRPEHTGDPRCKMQTAAVTAQPQLEQEAWQGVRRSHTVPKSRSEHVEWTKDLGSSKCVVTAALLNQSCPS